VKSLWLLVLAGVASIAVAFLASHGRVDVPDKYWTNERMAEEMAKLGYKSEWVDADGYPGSWTQGLYLAREEDARSWEDIVGARTRKDPETLWRGIVVVSRVSRYFLLDRRPESLYVGAFWFYGDPAEISRIARHFGVE
jgi:hypothetical protein